MDLWVIAWGETGITRPKVGNAANSLGIKVSPCQLGAIDQREVYLNYSGLIKSKPRHHHGQENALEGVSGQEDQARL